MNDWHSKIAFMNHLRERGLSPEGRTASIQCWIDWNGEIVTFPLWSPVGSLIGYQRYIWNAPKLRRNQGRYYTWITEEYKPIAVWNVSCLMWRGMPATSHCQPVLVTEGIWDAIRCIQCGYDAVATLTCTPTKQFVQWFKLLTQGRKTIAIMDNDENNAGLGLAEFTTSSILCEGYKDIGDMGFINAKRFLDAKV